MHELSAEPTSFLAALELADKSAEAEDIPPIFLCFRNLFSWRAATASEFRVSSAVIRSISSSTK
jgi:hypothetical protein